MSVISVNLGGLFVLEPFISPALFQAQSGTTDEWSLSQVLTNLPSGNNLSAVMEEHYSTFITEEDIAEIAGGFSMVIWSLRVNPGTDDHYFMGQVRA